MTAVTRPRGPLPSRVYWTRRVLVLLVAFALVFAVGRLLGGGSDDDGTPSARPVGADESSPPPSSADATSAPAGDRKDDQAGKPGKKNKPLPEPDGPCEDGDVIITPKVEEAHAGAPIDIVLKLTARTSAACTWEVSPESVILKVTSGIDPIWSSQECPLVIPTESVVPRRKKADKVTVVWDGKRSDSDCSAATDWAFPGWYHAEAVARGSVHPVDVQFELEVPERRTITPTPTPTPTPTAKPKPAQKEPKAQQGKTSDR